MRHLYIYIYVLLLLSLTTCKTQQAVSNPSEEITLSGTYETRRGVMDALSCFCYNGGYITTAKGERIAICIADEGINIDCKRVLVKGKYLTVTKEKEPNGVCAGGTMTYFEANTVSCY
jgi:hypothetical protein